MEFRSYEQEEERAKQMRAKAEADVRLHYDKDMAIIHLKALAQRILVDRNIERNLTKQDEEETYKINKILNDLGFTEMCPYF